MRKLTKKIIALVLTVFMISAMLPMGVFAAGENDEYVLYPIPHEISYQTGSYELKNFNVIYGSGIDDATKARLNETAALRELSVNEGPAVTDGSKTNIYVAINGSSDAAANYIISNYTVEADLFNKTDAYFLASDNNEIVVLGKDVDSCFYGLTTLYQIFGQLESNTLRNFTIKDYADVASRGFIEGYYGNPWSTQDRINLMTWGGYYKLNSYFYAPKDDPKHNAKWRELYTEEEINTLIKPLAEAGNASKCRFVYALHPYMHNPITSANYDSGMADMKAKFMQVIDAGVRQIAILADDAGNQGGTHYVKMLTDMTAWINELRQQEKYADLKLLLPFVTQEYMYFGESYYRNFPENVQIVMTGGQVWGFCSPSFTNTFYNNVGRGTYLWINWPCTDNSKNHLIMGGYSDFLQVGVDPAKVEGIVLNPMQQSEPSKVAIFGNACYTWNIWETKAEADGAWETAFACVDHNTVVADETSDALKELSKHMIDQTRFEDNPNVLEESVVLRHELSAFRNKLNAGTYTVDEIDSLIEEFTILQDAAKTYRERGHEDIVAQIMPWLGNWDDTTVSVISYLNALKAIKNNDGDDKVWGYYADGQAAYESSRNHPLWYLDHYEYAESGYRFIVPFMRALGTHLSEIVVDIVYPNGVPSGSGSSGAPGSALRLTAFEGNNPDHYSGSVANVVDGNTSTTVWYNDYARVGQFIGVDMGRSVLVGKVNFTQDSGDRFAEYTLQYSTDGETYHDYKTYTDAVLNVDLSGTGIEARYLRFYSTATSSVWVKIAEISVTEAASTQVDTNNAAIASWETRIGNETAQLLNGGEATMAPGDYVGFDLRRIKDLSEIAVTGQGDLTLQVSVNGVDWVDVTAGAVTEDGRYVRLINKTDADVTVDLTAFTVTSDEVAGPSLLESNVGINSSWGVSEDSRENGAAFDGNVGTTTEFGDFVAKDQYIIYDLGQVRDIYKLEIYCSDAALNYIRDAKIQISNDLSTWTDVITIGDGVENTGEASVTCINSDAGYSQATSSYPNFVSIEGTIDETPARYLRILMTAPNNERAVLFNEIEINEGEYVSVSNDPTFVTSDIEVQGHAPQNMTDNDLTTSWKPDTEQGGSMVYTFSDNLTANRIHVVQKTISNAKVSLYAENDGQRAWIDMGNLDKSLVALECENDLNLALKIEWEAGQTPNITEIVRFSTEPANVTKVELAIGEEKTFLVNGDYTGADVSQLNQAIASVELEGIAGSSTTTAGSAVTTLVSGNDYLLVNTRAGKTVTNASSSTSETEDGTMAGLKLEGNTANFSNAAVWTITATDTANVYNVQSSNGKYMTIGANAGGLLDAAQPITMVYANNNWTLMQNGAYLNDAGGLGTTASGWKNDAAATDPGSQFTIHELVTNEVIGSTNITFTGVAAGTTSVEIGGVVYEITVKGEEPEPGVTTESVTVEVDETKTIVIDGENLENEVDTTNLDPTIATVTVTGTSTPGSKSSEAVSPAATALEDGIYMLVNTRANKPMTSAPASWDEYSGLALEGTADAMADAACWLITGTGTAGVFTIQERATGKYLTLNANNHAELGTAPATVTIATNGETFTISNGEFYLNNAGGQGQCAFGWNGEGVYDAPTDQGSQWALHKVALVEEEISTTITILGVSKGETSVKVGDTVYEITVVPAGACTHAQTEVRDTVEADCENPGYTGDTYCTKCGELVEAGTETTALGHAYGTPVFDWAEDYSEATATFTCTRDESHVHEEDAQITESTTHGDCTNPSAVVYTATVVLEGKTYIDEKTVEGEIADHYYVNGFCTGCDGYEAAKLVDGVYQITNGGNLYWFAELVNSGADEEDESNGETYNAVLTNDIFVNKDVIVDGELTDDVASLRQWRQAIGKDADGKVIFYSGTFDGQGYSISGLYADSRHDNFGLFGNLDTDGVVKNVIVKDSYICAHKSVGAIVGRMGIGENGYMKRDGGQVIGCGSVNNIVCSEAKTTSTGKYVGGVVGFNRYGTIEDCWNTGAVYGREDIGGVVGYTTGDSNGKGDIVNCWNAGDVHSTEETTVNYGGNIGGVVGSASNCVVSHSFNEGNVEGRMKTGGIVGYGLKVTVENCYNAGDISVNTTYTDYAYVGGIVGYGYLTTNVTNSHNVGQITAETKNTAKYVGAIVGTTGGTVENSYYLAEAETDELEGTTAKNADVFASGEITWLLNGSTDEGELVWFQTIGEDAYPVFEGYVVHHNAETDVYYNTHEHVYDCKVATEDYLATPADCENPATYYFSCECGEKGEETFEHGEALGHEDKNPADHKCDKCGKSVSECADADKDHKCDLCGKTLTECVDENKDYKCDICGKDLEKPEDPTDPTDPEQPEKPVIEDVTRLAGANRWETSLKVADEMKANLGLEKFDSIIIASGNDFADALAGSYLSTVKNAPILLGWGKGGKYVTLDEANIAYIKANLAEGGTVYILGGKNAVPELYETELKGYNVKRLGGANRFETNLLILAEAGVNEGDEILVCTSTNFADSLSASATAKPILLVFNEYGKLYGKQPDFLAGLKNCTFTVIGGESAVSPDLAKAIEAYGKVERLAGANRFETSVLVAQKYFASPETAVLAYAWNYPDGLCGGSLAYSLKAPLILTMTKYEAKAVEYAKNAGIEIGLVLGGDTLISDDAVRSIFAMDKADEIIVK